MPKKGKEFYVTRETFLAVLRDTYNNNPSLVPFSGGDRAGLLGYENAKTFAERKWKKQAAYLSGPNHHHAGWRKENYKSNRGNSNSNGNGCSHDSPSTRS